jgi:glycosyltransferase involved in cell wall biosynthesis
VAGNSEWVAGEAKRSSLLGNFPIQAIHYGIDLETFRPRDKESARRVLGIPAEAALVMFVADGVSNPRKGFAYLVEALKQLRASRPTVLLSVGRGNQRVEGPFEHLHLGSVNNDFFLSIAYSAADVFVIPSLEESFGLTLIEAAACGVAGVGFQAGGIPELIEPGGTGFVVPLKDSAALAGRISEIISDPARCREMGVRSRKRAECLFSLEVQGRKYRDLYAEACGKK